MFPLVFELESGQIVLVTAAKVLADAEKRETFLSMREGKRKMSITDEKEKKQRKNFAELRCRID